MSLERRLAIMSLIPQEPRSITADKLHEKLRNEQDMVLSLRSVQRHLIKLHEMPAMGVCYYEGEERTRPPRLELRDEDASRPSNQTKRWYISRDVSGIEIPSMDPEAATVLKLAERYLSDLLPEAVLQNIGHYFRRADAVMNKPGRPRGWLDVVAMVPKALPLQPPRYDKSVANRVFQAIKYNRQLRVRSITRHSPDIPKEYVINPLGVVLRDSVIYIVWTAAGDPEDRVKEFALHRLREATLLETPRDLPLGFSLDRFIHEQQGFGYLVRDEPGDIVLVMDVDPILRFTLSETALSGDQTIEKLDERRYRVTATVKNTYQLRAWLMEKSPQATVLEPDFVRDDIVGQIERVREQYQQRTSNKHSAPLPS